jgi:nickel-dependent lactate racemase
VTKVGGGIVLATPCPEGVSVAHPRWIEYLQHNTEELMRLYKSGAVDDLVALGLALNVAHIKSKHPICIVTKGISDRDATRMGFRKSANVEEAVQYLSQGRGPDSRINILTHGGETYPTTK